MRRASGKLGGGTEPSGQVLKNRAFVDSLRLGHR